MAAIERVWKARIMRTRCLARSAHHGAAAVAAPTRLTSDTVPSLLTGLMAAAWSVDGAKLLARFNGRDTIYTVTTVLIAHANPPDWTR